MIDLVSNDDNLAIETGMGCLNKEFYFGSNLYLFYYNCTALYSFQYGCLIMCKFEAILSFPMVQILDCAMRLVATLVSSFLSGRDRFSRKFAKIVQPTTQFSLSLVKSKK